MGKEMPGFKAKKYKWEPHPASCKGWFVMAWYIVPLFIFFRNTHLGISLESSPITTIIPFVIIASILFVISHKAGEKPEWSWGNNK